MHEPVLLEEVMDLLDIKEGFVCVDGTLGRGGHTLRMLEKTGPEGHVFGIDRDEDALKRVADRLKGKYRNFTLIHGNYSGMADLLRDNGARKIDCVLLDLGVSSEQVDTSSRGFSFMKEGPLDMRMDRSQDLTAADLVNSMDEAGLRSILREFGEEKKAGRIVKAIIRRRAEQDFLTTADLAAVVERAAGGRRGRIHPATRTFQALRMAVNSELDHLREGLADCLSLLSGGGRMAVISFHSIEDRIVKKFFAEHAGRWESLQEGGRRWIGSDPAVRRVTRKPVRPTEEEIERNPRSRSAKLRVVEIIK